MSKLANLEGRFYAEGDRLMRECPDERDNIEAVFTAEELAPLAAEFFNDRQKQTANAVALRIANIEAERDAAIAHGKRLGQYAVQFEHERNEAIAENETLKALRDELFDRLKKYEAERNNLIGINPPCAGCGGAHPFDTSISSPLWNEVVRDSGLRDYLCLLCVVKAFAKAGRMFVAQLWGNDEGIDRAVIEFRPDGTESSHEPCYAQIEFTLNQRAEMEAEKTRLQVDVQKLIADNARMREEGKDKQLNLDEMREVLQIILSNHKTVYIGQAWTRIQIDIPPERFKEWRALAWPQEVKG